MENSFKKLINKTKEGVISGGKKAILAGGLLLGTLGSQELKGQDISKKQGIENIDSSLYKEAEKEYEKIMAHRDSIIEYNKNIKSMNTGSERLSSELIKFCKKGNEHDVHFWANRKFSASTSIEQKDSVNHSMVSSVGSMLTGKHVLSFQDFDAYDICHIKDEFVSFKNLKNYKIDFVSISPENKILEDVQNIYNQYTDKNTNRHPKYDPTKSGSNDDYGHYGVTIFNALPLDYKKTEPEKWKVNEDDVYSSGDVQKPDYTIGHFSPYFKEKDKENARIKGCLGKDVDVNKIFNYKDIEPKKIKISIYQACMAEIRSPRIGLSSEESVKSIDEIEKYQSTTYQLAMICSPVWEEKLIQKIPKKEKFISEYISSHQTKILENKLNKDTVVYVQPKIDSVKKFPEIEIKSDPFIQENKSEYFKETPEYYPIYGPRGGLIGYLPEWGKFIPLPKNDRGQPFPEDVKIMEEYDNGKTDYYIETIKRGEYGLHDVDGSKKNPKR